MFGGRSEHADALVSKVYIQSSWDCRGVRITKNRWKKALTVVNKSLNQFTSTQSWVSFQVVIKWTWEGEARPKSDEAVQRRRWWWSGSRSGIGNWRMDQLRRDFRKGGRGRGGRMKLIAGSRRIVPS